MQTQHPRSQSTECSAITGRQKIEAALSPQGSPEVPAVICYEGLFIRDHWDEVTGLPWWYAQSGDLDQQLGWRRQAIQRINQDWFILPAFLPRCQRENLRIDIWQDGVYRVDLQTGRQEKLERPQVSGANHANARSVRPEQLARTPAQIDAAIPLPAEDDLDTLASDGRSDLACALLREFGAELFPFVHVSTPLWNCYRLWGFEDMMLMVAERPDLVAHACGRFLSLQSHRVREAAMLGAAGVWIEDCFTDMVCPQVFETLHLRFLRPLIERIRTAGLRSIYYYCGNPNDRWDLLLSAGADALALEESKKAFTIDIEDVVRHTAGRCSVLGNLDAVGILEAASEEGLRSEITRQIAAGRRNGSRFIMSLGSPVTPGAPLARVQKYCDTAREVGGRAAV